MIPSVLDRRAALLNCGLATASFSGSIIPGLHLPTLAQGLGPASTPLRPRGRPPDDHEDVPGLAVDRKKAGTGSIDHSTPVSLAPRFPDVGETPGSLAGASTVRMEPGEGFERQPPNALRTSTNRSHETTSGWGCG